jgi:acetyltransferase-like isoleucine patch superfamily enzyme
MKIFNIINLICGCIKNQLRMIRDRLLLEHYQSISKNCRIDPRAIIRVERGGRLHLGNNVAIGAYSIIAVESNCICTESSKAWLEVGDGTYIGECNNIRSEFGISIGRKCLIAQGVSIISSNHSTSLGVAIADQPSRSDRTGVVISDDVWIGAGAVILPGVQIGSGAIVAANAVVVSNVNANTIVAGIPARYIKSRT